MSWHTCITNDLPDVRSCIVRGEHQSWCDGFGRYFDRDVQQTVILNEPCPGCLPSPAEFGYLCASHVTKLADALKTVPMLLSFLWSADSNGTVDSNAGGSHAAAGPRWPLRESRIQAAWITSALRNIIRVLDGDEWDLTYFEASAIPQAASAAQAVKIGTDFAAYLERFGPALGGTRRGAEACVRFVSLVQNAYRRFPIQEQSRKIAGVRCPACGMPRLIWKPPLAQLGDVVITCGNCGHDEPQKWLEQWTSLVEFRQAV